jgi:hypothetical protein
MSERKHFELVGYVSGEKIYCLECSQSLPELHVITGNVIFRVALEYSLAKEKCDKCEQQIVPDDNDIRRCRKCLVGIYHGTLCKSEKCGKSSLHGIEFNDCIRCVNKPSELICNHCNEYFCKECFEKETIPHQINWTPEDPEYYTNISSWSG